MEEISIREPKPITIENLIESGWKVTGDGAYPAEKIISKDKENDENRISLVIHRLYNCETLALVIPSGIFINIHANNMDELNLFEQMIMNVDFG